MKALFILMALFTTSHAHAWNKIIECNNGELVVDQGDNDSSGRPTYQLVLRGQPLNYFVQAGAVDAKKVNTKGEFITWLNTYDGQLMGFISNEASSYPHTYRYYWVTRINNEVLLRSTIGNRQQGESEKANWKFFNCR
ncbi:MAG: hypothetical protein ACXWRE_03115 [Pseudobdellovibrionaceae bacterium]